MAGAALHRESPDAEGAAAQEPERNFAGTRLAFIILLIAAILLPIVYVSVAAMVDLGNRKREASYATSRVARIAEEHAIKVFDLNQGLDERVIDLLGNASDDDIRQHQQILHDRLVTMSRGYPQVASVSVLDGQGSLLVNSVAFPAPNVPLAGRIDFPALLRSSTMEVSPLMIGLLSKRPVFNTSIAKRSARGELTGVVSVALKADYFYDFYKELVGNERSMTVGLVRENGALLAHYPPADAKESRVDRAAQAPAPFRRIADLLNRLISDSKNGTGSTTLRSGGEESIVAYRRVADYPVFVFASYPNSAIISGWLQHIGLLAAGVFIPCIVLWAVIGLSLRRLSADEKTWHAWQAEANTRRTVEAAFRQARRTQALGDLVGTVAHDFNNLLMTMSANAQIVRRRGPENVVLEVAAIERAIKSGKMLTRQLLGAARKQPQRIESLRLQDWLHATQPLFAVAAGPQIAISIDVAAETWNIDVDAAELELALMNVVSNARDAMPGDGDILIVTENITLGERRAAFSHAGDYVRLSVSDSGTGMSQAVLQRAFEPLFTTKTQSMGTGLGLPQVSGFCELAGGTATIESELGRGTIVRFYLPRGVLASTPEMPATGHEAGHEAGDEAAHEPVHEEEHGSTQALAPGSTQERAQDEPLLHFAHGGCPVEPVAEKPSSVLDGTSIAALDVAPSPVEEDAGTTPASRTALAEDVEPKAAGPAAVLPDSRISILLVEDNPEVAAGTEALLSIMGHRAQWVETADAAYELLLAVEASAAAGFDMVLSDIHMPGKMTGIDLALRLRSTLPRLPVVLVTGYASEIDRAKQARIPVLAKPFDVEVLEGLIAQASSPEVRATHE
jgi:signal transduction histidine kinase/CheY-like chemotaxis protein